MSPELIQITPALPPSVSGVGDYALLLAEELRTRHGMGTHFVNGDLLMRGREAGVAPFSCEAVWTRSAAALLKILESASPCRAVLLHYVGHGYAKRGCPFWLVRALEQWKRKNHVRLIVLFHEVSGTGPVWTSGFWTSRLQSRLASRLALIADGSLVTTEVAAARLRATLPAEAAARVSTLAVFSTLGEPAMLLPYGQRPARMVVFGSGNWRKEAYTRYLPEFREACQRLRIKEIIDIGSPISVRPDLPIHFHEAGVLAAPAASECMNQARAGFFTYPVLHVGKSTIFAAYCAHGLLPVTFTSNTLDGDENLRPNQHFLAGSSFPDAGVETFAAIAAAAANWYKQHRLEVQARRIRQALIGPDHDENVTPT